MAKPHQILLNLEIIFAAMGTAIIKGRDFGTGDLPTTVPVAIVNRVFVDRYLKGRDPIGVQFSAGWWASDRTQSVLHAVGTLAGLLLVAFLLLALIQGLLAGEPTAMVRAAVLELPMSVLGTVVLVAGIGMGCRHQLR